MVQGNAVWTEILFIPNMDRYLPRSVISHSPEPVSCSSFFHLACARSAPTLNIRRKSVRQYPIGFSTYILEPT